MPRPWFRMNVEAVLAPEYTMHPLPVRGAHQALLAIATREDAGGIIRACRAWDRRMWDRLGGLKLTDVERVVDAELARWDEKTGSLEVFGYDHEGEHKARARSDLARNAAKELHRKRAECRADAEPAQSIRHAEGEGEGEGEDGTGEGEQPALPGLAAQAPSGRPTSKPVDRDAVLVRLWALQDKLRRGVEPKARPLRLTHEARKLIGKLLDEGFSEADCEHVLRVYEAEARAKGSLDAAWFNGETNWRPANFARAQAREIADAERSSGRRVDIGQAPPSNVFAGGDVDLDETLAAAAGGRP